MLKLIVCLLGILISLPLSGQEIVLQGKVEDKATGDLLPGAHINIQGRSGVITDIDGFFSLSIPTGSQAITISYTGYKPLLYEFSTGEEDTLFLIFQLSRQDHLLSQVVVTSSKFEQPLSEVTVSMDVIKSDFIESNNNITLDEALNKSSGITIVGGQANIRGGSGYSYGAGSRVMILMNDLPILTGDAGFPSWSFIPMENIHQVEIIKGASSALYGSSALNGIVHLRTAYAVAKPKTKVTLFNGFYGYPQHNITDEIGAIKFNIVNGDTLDADTTFKEKAWWKGRIPMYTGAVISHAERVGDFDLVAGAYLYSEESYLQDDYERRGRLSFSTRYSPKNNKRLSIALHSTAQLNRSATFFVWNGFGTKAYQPLSNTITINKGLRIALDPSLTYFNNKGSKHKLLGRYYRTDNTTDKQQGTLSDSYFGEYQFQHRFDSIGLVLTAGLNGSYTFSEAELYGDSVHTASNTSVYLQGDKRFFSRLNVALGFRYERNKMNREKAEAKPVARLGFNYKLADFTFLRASFGQGYRFPTIAEKFVRTDVGVLNIYPNPSLKSETGWSAEIGIKQGLQLGVWKGYVDAAIFKMQYLDMMEFTFGGVDGLLFGFQSVNIGDTDILGAEIAVMGEGKLDQFEFVSHLGYTFIDPKFQVFDSITAFYSSADFNVLKYRFRHTANADLQFSCNNWNMGFAGQYYSFMEAVDYVFELLLPGVKSFRDANDNGELILDMNLGFKLSETSKISLIIKNMLNNEYTMRPAMMEAPRSFTLQFISQW